jgi:hypothetical protein
MTASTSKQHRQADTGVRAMLLRHRIQGSNVLIGTALPEKVVLRPVVRQALRGVGQGRL